jgi:multicomponent Na+:H+ antiporter subunit B
MDAPDVAMTEASIGACASTIMLLLAYRKLSDNSHDFKSEQIKFTDILSFCVCFSIFLIAVSKMQNIFYPYGLSETLLHTRLSDVYVSATNANIEILSPVASILASFRGFDTLGETFVILCTAMGVLLIMSL